jgi:putative heme-binding domain-containing protein
VSLPWYEPIRFYHVISGGHYGWQAPQRGQFWRWPPYFPDVVAPVASFGRGSPTGVVCYRQTQFPARYRGGIFLLDWTFGRVYFVTLKRSGSTYTAQKEIFLEAVGENGFAPTAVAIHPRTGDLFISIGGRGTRGAVYRIRYPKGKKSHREANRAAGDLKPRTLDWRPELAESLIEKARSEDALTRRNALAALKRHSGHFKNTAILEAIRASWDHPDRYVRMTCADLIASLPDRDCRALTRSIQTPRQAVTFFLGCREDRERASWTTQITATKTHDRESRLGGVRLMQISLGDLMSARKKGTVWEGYSARLPGSTQAGRTNILAALRAAFPSEDHDLDREITRTLALLEDDDPVTRAGVADRLTSRSDPVDDFHYLIVLACLKGKRSEAVTARTAAALLDLDRKLTARHYNRDLHWPLRLAETFDELARKDPGLHAAILTHADFGRPAHAVFARADGFDRRRAAQVFLARAKKDPDYQWTPALIDIVGTLPAADVFPVLRGLWERGGLEGSILKVLARKPQAQDRDKFLAGLNSAQTAVVRRCLEALATLPPRNDGPTLLSLIQALRRLSDGKDEKLLADQLVRYLQKLTGQVRLVGKDGWTDWLRKAHPSLAGRLGADDGVDVAAWDSRLARLDWSAGEASRGQKIFLKASCAACHSGTQALGPDLSGVAGRFSRRDLFTAILQPSKDVSPRYRTTQVTTADGKSYQGIVIYEAVDSLILQTGAASTIRIVNKHIAERRVTAASLMPAGLIDRLTDMEIADLYAYLKGLGAKK